METGDGSDTYVRVTKLCTALPRLVELRDFFTQQFGVGPKFFVKVPGRVNLIGEHIDYCGYPVLPMAIEQNILLAVAPTFDNRLQLRNIQTKFENFNTTVDAYEILRKDKESGPKWFNYFLCGIKGVQDHMGTVDKGRGMLVAISGNVPPAAGLSSSSALVSAATLASAYLHEIPLQKHTLAQISAKCERYIGTEGGFMDQAIAFLAEHGSAQFIDWTPLTATPVALPPQAIFVIANSLAEANKAATSDFNERVVECRLGCRLIAKHANLNWRNICRFADVQQALNYSLKEIESYAEQILTQNEYTRDELMCAFDMKTETEFECQLLTANTVHMRQFKLRQRALHVFGEAIRVTQFRRASIAGDIHEMGKLMRKSHDSLQMLYECSHPRLDQLVKLSDQMDVSARLTGAGWGGCIVALCHSISACNEFIALLKRAYYLNDGGNGGKAMDDIVFATSPQGGAEILIDIL